jgi:hypothetical protein
MGTWRKSTYSGASGGDCIEVASWRNSTYSGGSSGACVECGTAADVVLVRDTTDRDGVTLSVSTSAWSKFTSAIR